MRMACASGASSIAYVVGNDEHVIVMESTNVGAQLGKRWTSTSQKLKVKGSKHAAILFEAAGPKSHHFDKPWWLQWAIAPQQPRVLSTGWFSNMYPGSPGLSRYGPGWRSRTGEAQTLLACEWPEPAAAGASMTTGPPQLP